MTAQVFRGEILTLNGDPSRDPRAVVHHRDGALIVEDGVILECDAWSTIAAQAAGLEVVHFPDAILTPGFIDAHVHYPQSEHIAAHGAQLLDWLDQYIFPAELAFADRAHADDVAAFFLDELLRNGTTSALVYATVHPNSVDALLEAALERGMRIISGKVLMDGHAPEGLRDTPETGLAQSEALIRRWRGRGRIGYAITPRYALTCSEVQLAGAGQLLQAYPDVLLHTHMAENRDELAAVAGRFPDAADYLEVYDRFGLVGRRSVFAHCIHMNDRMAGRLSQAGAAVAFCPSSNLFLGSGLFDLAQAQSQNVKIGLGTDVAAGTSFSMLATQGEAYKVCQMRGVSLDPFHAFYLATLGGAVALGLGDRIGRLAPGYEADFLVLDPAATPLLARRLRRVDTMFERLFALQVLGDDRVISHTYVAGVRRHSRSQRSDGVERD